LRVSLTIDPPKTFIAKNMRRTFIYFLCQSDWKCLFSHSEDFEISHLSETLIILNIIGSSTRGTFIMVLLLDRTITTPPTIISIMDRIFIERYFIYCTFSEVPMQIHRISCASCAQFTDIWMSANSL
jgi:hypothetical protein